MFCLMNRFFLELARTQLVESFSCFDKHWLRWKIEGHDAQHSSPFTSRKSISREASLRQHRCYVVLNLCAWNKLPLIKTAETFIFQVAKFACFMYCVNSSEFMAHCSQTESFQLLIEQSQHVSSLKICFQLSFDRFGSLWHLVTHCSVNQRFSGRGKLNKTHRMPNAVVSLRMICSNFPSASFWYVRLQTTCVCAMTFDCFWAE